MPTINAGPGDDGNLQTVADCLAQSRRIVVVTGAGISTNCGIPDFRSKNGLYSLIQSQYDARTQRLQKQEKGLVFDSDSERKNLKRKRYSGDAETLSRRSKSPEQPVPQLSSQNSTSSTSDSGPVLPSNVKGKDLFDARIWSSETSTSVFFSFIASLREKIRSIDKTTATHKFIRTLRDGGRLVRCYTQNIDGIEAREGLCLDLGRGKGNRLRMSKKVVAERRPDELEEGSNMDGGCEVVQLHGDLDSLRCDMCQSLRSWDEDDLTDSLLDGVAPTCEKCIGKDQERQNKGRRGTSVGSLRPNVVLYGEDHPASNVISEISEHDLGLAPDALVIMGTSLRVHGLKYLVREFAKAVHSRAGEKGKVIFVNNTKPPESVWGGFIDYWVGMDCDDWVEDLKSRRKDLWTLQGEVHKPEPKTKDPLTMNKKQTAEHLRTAKYLLLLSTSGDGSKSKKRKRKKQKIIQASEGRPPELQMSGLSRSTVWKTDWQFSANATSAYSPRAISEEVAAYFPIPTPPNSARSVMTCKVFAATSQLRAGDLLPELSPLVRKSRMADVTIRSDFVVHRDEGLSPIVDLQSSCGSPARAALCSVPGHEVNRTRPYFPNRMLDPPLKKSSFLDVVLNGGSSRPSDGARRIRRPTQKALEMD